MASPKEKRGHEGHGTEPIMKHTEITAREQLSCAAESPDSQRLRDEFVASVRDASDIEAVAAPYGQIAHHGVHSLTPCPCQRHSTERPAPSLFLDQDEQVGKCCLCLAKGDAFWLVMEHEQICYRDAVRLLASRHDVDEPADITWSAAHKRRPQSKTEPDSLRNPLTLRSFESPRRLKI